MIRKVIIGIGLSIMSVSGIRMFADSMEDWKASVELQSAIEELKNPEKAWELCELIENRIGESLWSEVLVQETQKNGLEKLKEFYQYLLSELNLNVNEFIYNDLCEYLDQLKELADKAENTLEVGFYKTLIALEIEIEANPVWGCYCSKDD